MIVDCINKSHPDYKRLSRELGDEYAELFTREFTSRENRLRGEDSGEFIVPNLTEVKRIVNEKNRSRVQRAKNFRETVKDFKNVNREVVYKLLNGIVRKGNRSPNQLMVIKGPQFGVINRADS